MQLILKAFAHALETVTNSHVQNSKFPANAQVRIIPDGQALAGQFGAFARADNPGPLPAGHLLPFVGRIVEAGDGRDAFELELGRWRGKTVVLDPDPRCAGTLHEWFMRRRARQCRDAGGSRASRSHFC